MEINGKSNASGYMENIFDSKLVNTFKISSSLISNLQVNWGIIPINISKSESLIVDFINDNRFSSWFPISKNISINLKLSSKVLTLFLFAINNDCLNPLTALIA